MGSERRKKRGNSEKDAPGTKLVCKKQKERFGMRLLHLSKAMLYQLNYAPTKVKVVANFTKLRLVYYRNLISVSDMSVKLLGFVSFRPVN